MRALHLTILGLLAVAATAPAPSAQTPMSADDVKRKLLGNWKLVKYETFAQSGAGGPATTSPPPFDSGRIMYDEAGHMAAQLTRPGRPVITRESTDRDRLAAAAGYVAYYGKYDIDVAKGTVSHHVEGSTNTSWVGTTLVRSYEFSPDANRLMLSLKNAEGRVTATLTWERLR